MSSRKQKIARIFIAITAFVTLVIVCVFLFRNALLENGIGKIQSKLETEYDCNFSIKEAKFESLTAVTLNQLIVVPKKADTLLSVEKINVKINLFAFFTGTIQIDHLEIKNGYIQLIKNKKGRNFDAFLHREKEENTEKKKKNYAKLVFKLLTKILNLVPENMELNNISLKLNDMGRKVNFHMKALQLRNKNLKTDIDVATNTFEQSWKIKGFADPRNKQIDLRFFNSDTSQIKVPYVDERYNIKTSFDSIRLKIETIKMNGDELHVNGFTSITNFTINNAKIANKEVTVKKALFDYRFLLGADFISVDSSSTMQLNQIKTHPYLEYNTAEDTIYKLRLTIPTMKANDFINSLPAGLFTHFEGMQAEGNFDYKLNFKFNKNKPQTLVFESHINKQNLKITKYGAANLAKLNNTFTYSAIENGRSQRPIVVGSTNPNYTPFDQIAPFLQKCVLTSEDPSFFSHHGFINEAFKQSILKNIRTKKFSRGASTISMQLVKNVFLNREKTLSRKLEEILLVYILENNRITSKQRMLEVYFNVIEWGPNVYGIGEAASFYFDKKPANLTLKECLFLSSIVPKPKRFMGLFDSEGNLKTNTNKQQTFISNLMLRRGIITPEDTIGQYFPLKITGRARSFMKFKELDSIPSDSILIYKKPSL
jgi:hypothetical protein